MSPLIQNSSLGIKKLAGMIEAYIIMKQSSSLMNYKCLSTPPYSVI